MDNLINRYLNFPNCFSLDEFLDNYLNNLRNLNDFLNNTRNHNNFLNNFLNFNNFGNLNKFFNNLINSHLNFFDSLNSSRNFNNLLNFAFNDLNIFNVLNNRLFDLNDLGLIDNLLVDDLYRDKLRNMYFLNHNLGDFFRDLYYLFLDNWHLYFTINNFFNFLDLFNDDIDDSFNLFDLNDWDKFFSNYLDLFNYCFN